jgi:nucleoside-diphosphate-sugar epimerase
MTIRADQGADVTRVLVTGGAGFIGSNVVALLRERGHAVVVLDDLSSGYAENLRDDCTFVQADVRDGEDVRRAAADCAVIWHLAASVGNKRSIDNPQHDSATNVLGMLNVLEAARAHGIERVVFSSSAGIFGELKSLPIAEDHPQEPDSPYGVSKLAAEKHCLVYNKLYGMRNVCLRYFNVYGPNQRFDAYGNVIPIFAERALTGRDIVVFGDGEQTRDFVHVSDVAAANVAAGLHRDAAGVFNIGSATRVTINWLADTIVELSGAGVSKTYGPPRAGDVRDSLACVDAARSAFGYDPQVDLRGGLEQYLRWLRADPVSADKRERSS